jgi:phosphatidylethanolamine-binding protein (PEBP) family uncharacterized protein
MRWQLWTGIVVTFAGTSWSAAGHEVEGELHEHDRASRGAGELIRLGHVRGPGTGLAGGTGAAGAGGVAGNQSDGAPSSARAFAAFEGRVKVRWDERSLIVESDGMPAHRMMVGITAWQQQVPIPQAYFGENAWRIPLAPVPARRPLSAKTGFFRGAIAVAANGVPIFNPIKNDGRTDTFLAGELDEFGGHCGRADDYHYHTAPLHLQEAVGPGRPIAYALDGYAIYGLAEPDGSAVVRRLDEFNGHETAGAGYHYHASKAYPYVNGGFHGEVVERGGQVDPQPRAIPVRPDLRPLAGAKITDFTTSRDGRTRRLVYAIGERQGAVEYADAGGGAWRFVFEGTDGTKRDETYRARAGGGGAEGPPREGPPREGPPPRREAEAPSKSGPDALKKPVEGFVLSSPDVADGGALPKEYTGDGAGSTLPLVWKGAPAGAVSFAVVMDHLAPGDVMKGYWTVWDIPADARGLAKNVSGVGKVGAGFKGRVGYEPPHSQGPGAKTYVMTVYALSAAPAIKRPAGEVNREVLLAAIEGKVLGSASLRVVYTRREEPGRDAGK